MYMMGEYIGQVLDSPGFLKSRLIFGIIVGILSLCFFIWILFQMERHNVTYRAAVIETELGDRDTQLELEEEEDNNNNDDNKKDNNNKQKNDDNDNTNNTFGEYVQADNDDDDIPISSPTNSDKSVDEDLEKNNENSGSGIFKLGDTRYRPLSTPQKLQIIVHVLVLMLLNYLLLVFLPGSVILSLIAIFAIWIITLNTYIRDDITRRKRYDRVLTMLSLFFILAGCMTLITYCLKSIQEGSIYEGPARIIGYDDSIYTNRDGETIRADLLVEWGSTWGCPDNHNKICRSYVSGALCQTKYDPETYNTDDLQEVYNIDDGYSNRRRIVRQRQLKQNDEEEEEEEEAEEYEEEVEEEEEDEDFDEEMVEYEEEEYDNEVLDEEAEEEEEEEFVEEEEEYEEEEEIIEEEYDDGSITEDEAVEEEEEVFEEEVIDEAVEEVDTYEYEIDEEYNEELIEDEEYLDSEYEEAVEEHDQEVSGNNNNGEDGDDVDELEEEIEDLEEDLEDEEMYAGELEDEIEDLTGGGDAEYVYEDDVYDGDYWDYDWDSVWGEYACEDLFDSDLSGESYDISMQPGINDAWPTVNIYGSCNACEAYIIDYYSTEHFLEIRIYELQSWLYLVFGFILLIFATIAAIKEKIKPTKEKEIVLLTNEGGVPA